MSHVETPKFLPFGSDPAPAPPPAPTAAPGEYGWFGPQDMYLFNEGSHLKLYDRLGSHPATVDGVSGYHFAVWAPNADYVAVIGDFNGWDRGKHRLSPIGSSGVWGLFIPGVTQGTCYKYHIAAPGGFTAEKTDPFAFTCEIPPKSAAVTWDLSYQWADSEWMANRKDKSAHDKPVSIYEVHLGSWMREADPPYHSLNYRDVGPHLAEYCKDMGFTHVELLPITEHPFFASWGYQTTGYFAATSRYGTPQDLMFLVDTLHQAGVGVILDWVPSHFATDAWALAKFDGTGLFEHADTRQGFHPDWGSFVFNYSRHEVRSFLLSSALFWLDKYHIDGIRVDAVASMLYLDYSRKEGEWIPNQYGGKENIDAISFLRRFNEEVYKNFPGRADVRGGIDRVQHGVAADVPRRAGLRVQVGHGVDARHAEVLRARPGPPQAPPERPHVPHAVRVQRELRDAALARRGGSRQGPAVGQDGRRRVAEVRQPPAAVRVPVGHDREEAPVHGLRDRASGRSGVTTRASTGTCWNTRRTRACRRWCAT